MNDEDIIKFVTPFTSVSRERIINVLNLIDNINNNNIPGDFIEIGVWKGGLIMAMALKCIQLGIDRKIHAYDTFEGMTNPSYDDVDMNNEFAINIFNKVQCVSLFNETKANIDKTNYTNIEYHVGDILKTDVSNIPGEISLLRLDTDWYESTKFELKNFYPLVSPGGIVIIDDYGHWKGCRKAVDDFLSTEGGKGKEIEINKIDYTGIWWQKDGVNFGKSILQNVLHIHPDSYPSRKLLENFHHFENIYKVLDGKFEYGWGSYLFNGTKYKYMRELLTKQEALYQVGEKSNSCLEIGVYLGHSLLILLLSNPNLKITCVDNDPRFAPKVVEYLNANFNNRITFYLGDAVEVVNGLSDNDKFDFIHIDADHNEPAVNAQFLASKRLAKDDAFIVFDDYEAVRKLIDGWISGGILKHVRTPWCLWTNIVTKLVTQ
jgi:predicted O-methyltransferase YrrM